MSVSINIQHCRPKSHFQTILKTTKSRLPVSTAVTANGSDRSFRNEANLKLTNYTNLSTTNSPSNESLTTKSEPDSQLAKEWNKRNFVKKKIMNSIMNLFISKSLSKAVSCIKFLTLKPSFLFTFGTKYPFSTTERQPPPETTERVKVEDLEAQLLDALDKLAENYDEEN